MIDEYKSYGPEVRFSKEVKQQRGQSFIFNYIKNSSKKVKNNKVDDENSLNPDIIVYTTIDDILNGKDPQMEKVIEIIRDN